MTYTLGFSYDEHTGELNPEVDIEDTLIDDDDFGRPEFIHSLTPWG